MINFVIKDNNDNIIYERYDEKGVLTEDEIAQIYEALENLDTNSVNISLDCKNMESSHGGRYSYSSLFHRSGKDEILKETGKVIDEYNRHVAALSDHHLSDVASSARDSDTDDTDGSDDCCDCGDDEDWLSDDVRDRLLHLLKKKFKSNAEFAPYSWQKHLDRYGWTTIPKHNDDFAHYAMLGDCRGDVWGRDGCGNRGIRSDCGLGVIPGSFCGPDYIEDDKHKEIMQKILDKCDCCESASEDVEPVEEWELTETQKHEISVLKDFIGYLRTRDSWATLLDEVGFYHDPDDDVGKQKLIDEFCEYMRRKENQEFKEWREKNDGCTGD